MRTKEPALSPEDAQEITDFADLLRAKVGLPPTDEMPHPVCLLSRPSKRTGYSKDFVPHE